MVNTESRSRHKNGEKRGSERQKLANELSFLAELISKHKEKPVAKESNQNASGYSSNQFSWAKEEPSSSSQSPNTFAFHKQGQRSQGPSYLSSKDSLTWKKVKEMCDDPLTTSATRYKYVSKDVHRTAIERGKNVSCAKGKADVCKEEKPSTETAIGQCPVPKRNVQARRIVIPPQGSTSLLKPTKTSSENSKAGLPSRKPMLVKSEVIGTCKAVSSKQGLPSKTTSIKHELEGSSSQSHRHSNNRRVVLPTSQKASVASALKPVANLDVSHGLSRNVGKHPIAVKPSESLSKAHTSTNTATKIIFPEQSTRIVQHQKQPAERPNAQVLATLSKELDKCLGDIARLKEARTQLKDEKSVSTAGIRKAPSANVRHTNSEIKASLDGSQKVGSSQGSILKPSNTNEEQRDSKLEKKAAGTANSAAATNNDYKWVAPKVKSRKIPSSHAEDINKTKVESADNLVQKKNLHFGAQIGPQIGTGMNNLNTGLKTMMQISSPQVKVIRTRYKMKKQLSTASTLSLISRHKVDRRNSVGTSAVKSTEKTNVQKCDVKISRYKLVKSSSHPGVLSQKHPETSLVSPPKQQIAINTRYKKVKGHPPAFGSREKSAIVIPHRSQLKLNRIKTKPHHKNTPKTASTSTRTRKQSRHKIDRRPRGTAVVRSRFKMRKVSNRTPRKTPPKQSSNSSPFKWQARKPTPPQPATPETFMRRRMHFVLTHTPVLLRTRFRLINSQHHNSTLTGLAPKQPLLKKTRTKLIRKSASTLPSPSLKHSRSRVVVAKGVHYHQSRSGKSLRRISGSSPILPSSSAHRSPSNSRWRQDSLSRVWTASAHRVYQRQGAMKVSSTQWVANRVLRRTIQGKIQRGNKDLKSQPYCKFYNRYGRCHRGDKCPYIHDPEKVAVCTQFLRGTCKKTDGSCPFSHKASKDKMPVCVYFLKGVCNRDNCPYSHVKVSKKAEVCQEFLHGYCPRGAKCKNKHTLDCAEFNETGQCKLGNKCPLWHRKRKTKSEGRKGVKRRASEGEKVSSKRSNTKEKQISKSKQDAALVEDGFSGKTDDVDVDVDTPKTDDESGSMPSFIALDSDSNQFTPEDSKLKKTSSLHFDPDLSHDPITYLLQAEDGVIHDSVVRISSQTPSLRNFGLGGRPALKIRPLFAPSMGASTSHQGQCSDSSSSSSSLLKPSVTTATGCSSEEQDSHP